MPRPYPKPPGSGLVFSLCGLVIAAVLCIAVFSFFNRIAQPFTPGWDGLGEFISRSVLFVCLACAVICLLPLALTLSLVGLRRARRSFRDTRRLSQVCAWAGMILATSSTVALAIPSIRYWNKIHETSPAQQAPAGTAEYAPTTEAYAWVSQCENYAITHDGFLPPDLETLSGTLPPHRVLPGHASDYYYFGQGMKYPKDKPHVMILATRREIAPGRMVIGISASPFAQAIAIDARQFATFFNDTNQERSIQDQPPIAGLPAISPAP